MTAGSAGSRLRAGLLCLLLGAGATVVALAAPGRAPWEQAEAQQGGISTVPVPPPDRPTTGAPTAQPLPQLVLTPGGDGLSFRLDLGKISLGSAAIIQSATGAPVLVLPRPIRIDPAPGDTQELVLPVVLPAGHDLRAFQDAATGIVWSPARDASQGAVLTIPLEGSQGTASLVLRTKRLAGGGLEAKAAINSAAIVVGPVAIQGAATGSVRLDAGLRRVPASLEVRLRPAELGDQDGERLAGSAAAEGLRVADLGPAAAIDTSIADLLVTPVIEMAAAGPWAERWDAARVRVARVTAEGVSLLPTTAAGPGAGGQVRFRAESSGGLSTFVLVALAPVQAPPAKTEPGNGSFTVIALLISALAAAAAVAGGVQWYRKSRL